MNANEVFLQKLLNDPSLLKLLEKMAKARPAINKELKLKKAGLPAHVNEVKTTCKLCTTPRTTYIRMDWDAEDKLYRSGCHHLDNVWADLPVHTIHTRSAFCKSCSAVLSEQSKEALIDKLIWLAEKHL